MIFPNSLEELASYVEQKGRFVFFFTADWCGDCHFILPHMPGIEEDNPQFTFIQINRDDYLDLAKMWDVYGIPSFVVIENGKERGRLVNRNRKTKEEINEFLASLA